ncbi:hypothetical protein C440_10618 [Haloferax mucosum ATCC BAA-1512]|uniref:DUF8135 domain-containing protein n=1 Tax=Haloferax mucosum ATCC BAA-1512 TaxID=662479 RepID=M0IDE3_9EURY|nr:hypothetical protein [Haloferax mucosum]ELZ94067.1 hypothetical protein C440_10618 [Haloferax mucosum ATCC BAA-1512]
MTDDTGKNDTPDDPDAMDGRQPEREPASYDASDWAASDSADEADATDSDRDGPERDGEESKSAPLSDLAGRVAERRSQSNVTSEADEDDLFESIEVGELDDKDVWTALIEDGDETETVGLGAEAEPVEDVSGAPDHVVPKTEFCQRCEFFGEPPVLACTHEGTTIVEVTDKDHFRVRNCPVVEDMD